MKEVTSEILVVFKKNLTASLTELHKLQLVDVASKTQGGGSLFIYLYPLSGRLGTGRIFKNAQNWSEYATDGFNLDFFALI